MTRYRTAGFITISSMLLSACAVIEKAPAENAAPLAIAERASGVGCEGDAASVDTGFVTGNIASCDFAEERRIDIRIAPEDAPPINCSAWYAFRVSPKKPGRVTVNLDYDACGHRYYPKTSIDGVTWNDLPESAVNVEEIDDSKRATLTLDLDSAPLFVAAQEIIGPEYYEAWTGKLAKRSFVTKTELGKSAEGRSIPMLSIKAEGASPKKQVVLIGRQHPPEVTGAFGLFAFSEFLVSDDPMARRFRERYEIIIVPMLNPDGVARGHWRHNTGGKDLNRDWGPFTQPETRLMQKLLADIKADPKRDLQLMLDFHSTWNDVFYTIPDEDATDPPLFTRKWLAGLQKRLPDYNVNRDANHQPDSPTSKAYSYATYGVPAITFELGDNTDRDRIALIGREAAKAMIETLIDDPKPAAD